MHRLKKLSVPAKTCGCDGGYALTELEPDVFGKRTLESCLEQLGKQVMDTDNIKAVMMSKDDNGDVVITLVEGREESHKVKFGRVDRRSRSFVRNEREHHVKGQYSSMGRQAHA